MKDPKKQQAEGTWKKFKGRVQEAWGDLTGDELDQYEGNREQLEGHIQKKTGGSRENVRKKIDKMAEETKHRI